MGTKRWAKTDTAGRVAEIVEQDTKPDLEPGYDFQPAQENTKVGDTLGRPGGQGQGQGSGGGPGQGNQPPGQATKPQPK